MTQTIYTVIGLLDEYGHRKIARCKTEVECFYPAETALADLFEAHLRRLIIEKGLQTEIKREIAESGHIYFHSEELNDLICSFYIEKGLTDLGRRKIPRYKDKKGYIHYAHGTIAASVFPPRTNARLLLPDEHDTRLAFLIGAYARYGKGNRFRFANTLHKVRVIERLLVDLGCTWLQITSNYKGAPSIFEIEFEMTEEMKNCFISYK